MRVLDPGAIFIARVSKGWTQRQLGAVCRPPRCQQSIQQLETGQVATVEPGVARSLADNLDLELKEVFAFGFGVDENVTSSGRVA
jgi:hypothetical protein